MQRTVNLALQGGGAQGAFTWGVLDRLLEEPSLIIEGISGTSAGAMNAAVLADGLEKGGREGAQRTLAEFWAAVSREGSFSPYRSGWWSPLGARLSPMVWMANWYSHWLSPYQANPLDYDPMRDVLRKSLDFERLRTCRGIKLFISATNVLNNRLKIFTAAELTVDVLLASACLPTLHQAVQIDGEAYWDGGFMGNPVLEPLLTGCEARDILIVQINPQYRNEVPKTAADIADRVNEITFNASLMREIRSIARMTRMLEELEVEGHHYERAYFHLIAGEDLLSALSAESKLDTSWSFLTHLRDRGRERADAWMTENWNRIGHGSTLDLDAWIPNY